MRNKQLLVACLVLAAMAAGFTSRGRIDRDDPYARILRERRLSGGLSAYAPNSATSDVGRRSEVDLSPLQVFYDALLHLRDEYVDPIQKPQERDLAYGALKIMLDSLHDPLTRFLDPDQAQLVQEASVGKFHGIGAIIAAKQSKQDGITEERLVVVSTLPGSPARQAGLLTGDVITELDGKTILPYDPFQRVEKLIKASRNGLIDKDKIPKLLEVENERIKNGVGFQKAADLLASKGTREFTLTVLRQGAKDPMKIKVSSTQILVDPITHAVVTPSVGYVHINAMIRSAADDFVSAIADLKGRGAKGMVIDLRDSPGGAIETAQSIAGSLIPNKTLSILSLPRGKQRTLKAGATPKSGAWVGPIVVLVNGGTMGASEVLAAGLRDGAGARLVGEKTFGNNLQQTFVPLRDGSAVAMTTGRYLTPRGADFRGKGLSADFAVRPLRPFDRLRDQDGRPGDDPQLAKAVELVTSGRARG